MPTFEELLQRSATLHQHLCPRQVLGVRMGLAGGRWLGLDVPQTGKRLLTIAETDGCATDGLAVATGCWVGKRTLRVLDFGKVAATFVDTHTRRAVRIVPSAQSRNRAQAYAPQAGNRWEAYLLGYQRMPDEELLDIQEVTLAFSIEKLLSRDGYRVNCDVCGEEIINEREVVRAGLTLCRPCAGERYYHRSGERVPAQDGMLAELSYRQVRTP
ncbi:MAG: FmdE family protein, partial [Anaerolineae bacterium]